MLFARPSGLALNWPRTLWGCAVSNLMRDARRPRSGSGLRSLKGLRLGLIFARLLTQKVKLGTHARTPGSPDGPGVGAPVCASCFPGLRPSGSARLGCFASSRCTQTVAAWRWSLAPALPRRLATRPCRRAPSVPFARFFQLSALGPMSYSCSVALLGAPVTDSVALGPPVSVCRDTSELPVAPGCGP